MVGVTGVAAVVIGATLLGAPSPFSTGKAGAAVPVPAGMAALNTVPVPLPTGLGTYVVDQAAATQLGKALFWDMHAGSDNVTACASCHFSAGTDRRDTNTLNPGTSGAFVANAHLTTPNFPLANGQVVGSQGVIPATFDGIDNTNGTESDTPSAPGAAPGVAAPGNKFVSNGANVRRVTGRNTPTVINAVFNFRNFWDGRAQNHFNGVNPFGNRDPNAKVAFFDAGSNTTSLVSTAGSLDDASLASQAVGPPGNNVEMSADGRSLRDIGKKLLFAGNKPLGDQAVDPTDSVLGALRDPSGKGLRVSYLSMIQAAFAPAWWNSGEILDQNGALQAGGPVAHNAMLPDTTGAPPPLHQYTQMQYNFGLFWGLAINLYEATLVSDQTPFDLYAAGDPNALSAQEQAGMTMFASKVTECSGCHGGAEMSQASITNVAAVGPIDNDGKGKSFDTGFMNIGVRPSSDDVGNAGFDPFGSNPAVNSLSETIKALNGAACSPLSCIANGSFKIPMLRNVALTAPYFHAGTKLTLAQVVDFYNRGGDFANVEKNRGIAPLALTAQQMDDIVAFLNALTDPRVQAESGPFDHPELKVPQGIALAPGAPCVAPCLEVPATGIAGRTAVGLSPGIPGFIVNPPVRVPPPPPGPPVGPLVNPVPVLPTPPAANPIIVRPPVKQNLLSLRAMSVKGKIRLKALRKSGLTVTLRLPAGTRFLRLQLFRVVPPKSGTGAFRQVLVLRLDKSLTRTGVFLVKISPLKLKKVTIGRYAITGAVGTSSKAIGKALSSKLIVTK